MSEHPTESEVARIARAYLVDATAAARILNLAGRQSIHYHVTQGNLTPVIRAGNVTMFDRRDVHRLQRKLHQ